MAEKGELRIGISGWTYEPWRGIFYPNGLVQKRELEYASRALNSIEINGSFYSLQTPDSYRKWYDAVPGDFLFSVKCPQYISHRKRLRDVRVPLANFFASGVLLLGKKMGPLLWQFPPWEKFDPERFEAFFELLPRTISAAAELAAENTIKDDEKRWFEPPIDEPLRYAIELRNESFFNDEFMSLLRKHKIALAFADTVQDFGYAEDVTSDLIYIRLHGKEELYASDYSEPEIDDWVRKVKAWSKGGEPRGAKKVTREKPAVTPRDVFVYFDNSIKVHAPFDAIDMSVKLGIKEKGPADMPGPSNDSAKA